MSRIWVVVVLLFQLCCCQSRQDFIPEGGKDLPLCKGLFTCIDRVVTDSYFFSHCLHPRFSSYYSHWGPSHITKNAEDEAETISPSVHDPNRSVLDSTTTNHLPTPNTCNWNDKKNSCCSMCDVDSQNAVSSCSNSTVPCHVMPFTPSGSEVETTVIPLLSSEDEELRIPEIDYKYSLSECTRNKWFEFSLSEMVSFLSFSHADRRRRHRRRQLRAIRLLDPRLRRLRQHRLPDAVVGFPWLFRGLRQQRAPGVSSGRGDVDEVSEREECEVDTCVWSG